MNMRKMGRFFFKREKEETEIEKGLSHKGDMESQMLPEMFLEAFMGEEIKEVVFLQTGSE